MSNGKKTAQRQLGGVVGNGADGQTESGLPGPTPLPSESTPNASGEKDWLEALIEEAERLAKERYDGHLAIMRFTGGWKCVLGTPQFTDGLSLEELIMGQRGQIERLEAQPTPEEAIRDLLVREGVK